MEAAQKAFERGEAQARQAESDVQAAELNLSYARVTAPADGYVTKKAVESGDYIQVGQKLMALVPTRPLCHRQFQGDAGGAYSPGPAGEDYG